jgi:hypothetical protein
LLEEALAPLADDLASRIQTRSDLVVVDALSGHQNHLGAKNLKVRQRIFGRPAVQLTGLIG